MKKAGSTTITATFEGDEDYKPALVNYVLNVTEKTPHGLAYATAEVAKVTTDAAFTNSLTNSHSLTVSYSSSATGVATVNSSTGEVTIKGAGSTTITATFAGDDDYESGSAYYTLTVSKATPTLSFASDNVTGRIGESVTANALTNPAGLTVTYSSSDGTVATVNSSTGVVANPLKAGTTTITATFAGNDTYTSGNTSYTLKVLANPTISVSDDAIAWGETFTVDDSGITGGDITVTSGNTSIATVDGLEITPVACGKVTITVSTAENSDYRDGSATFELTITEPAGTSDAKSGDIVTTFTDKDLNYSSGGVAWSASIDANSFESSSPSRGLQFGAAKGKFTLSTSAISGTITKVSILASTNESNNTMGVKVGDTDFECSDSKTITLTKENNVTYEFLGEATGDIVISCDDKAKSVYFKTITVTKDVAASVTIPSSGFGTYCCEYPLNIPADNTDYAAYKVTKVEGTTVYFKKISGNVKGGVPFVLYGTPGSYGIPASTENCGNIPDNNLLSGTLAPTFVSSTDDQYCFGMSSGKFKKMSGVLPAHKAYLMVDKATVDGESARTLNFVFEDDDEVTGINKVGTQKSNVMYDLQGRRITKPQRGQLYIVNGKKVLF
jgi:uncharacterized protein YjdB